ncbi:MAG: hypothetical protein NVSMB9_12840 [Isosphaeraceae bacterium]
MKTVGNTRNLGKPPKIEQYVSPPYTSRIIKAGALLADTKTLLAYWNETDSVADNLNRFQRENIFGKASRSRIEDILGIFRPRYLNEPEVAKALVVLAKASLDTNSLDRILFFHSARADSLLHDAVTEWLLPLNSRGINDIDVVELMRLLKEWTLEGKTTGSWSDNTIERIAQGLLSTLRDFGVLQGATRKRIAPTYLPIVAFSYIAFYLKCHQPSGAKLVEHPDWRLFFLGPNGVERFLIEAQQHGLLEYHAAGSVTRLTFPAETLEKYANVLAQRAH